MVAVVATVVIVAALVTAGIVFLGGGSDDGGGADAGPSPSASPTAEPSPEDSGTESDEPDAPDDGAATDFPDPDEDDDLSSDEPDDTELPSFLLQVGDCFDTAGKSAGGVRKKSCDGAHEAEVVSREELTGDYTSDSAVRSKADSLCREPLRDKAAEQPGGTVGGTLVSYPKAKGVEAGFTSVTCSLTAGKGKKLHKPLT
ncbi:hypothetical protein [Streptomyces cacaoi]|uniref:hypothetical protein n=1 Tax=Streptomyces cacaoi TaxID=1898 RepID=UPI0026397C6C|nr:hypothetical protein [Streptomyces cacaoi]